MKQYIKIIYTFFCILKSYKEYKPLLSRPREEGNGNKYKMIKRPFDRNWTKEINSAGNMSKADLSAYMVMQALSAKTNKDLKEGVLGAIIFMITWYTDIDEKEDVDENS